MTYELKDILDKWNLAKIAEYADTISGQKNGEHNAKNSSMLDRAVKKTANDLLQKHPTYVFEVTPWIAMLSLTDRNYSTIVKKETPYTVAINRNRYLLNLISKQQSVFGYASISNSLAYQYADRLESNNLNIGKKALGELVESLSNTDNLNSTSESIFLLNTMLEQFSVTNTFNSINTVADLQEKVENSLSTPDLSSLKYTSNFSNDLIDEVKRFVLQVYDAHPFSSDGITIYLKSQIAQKYVNHPYPHVLKKNGQSSTANQKHLSTPVSYISDVNIANMHDSFDTSKTEKASKFVTTVCKEFEKMILKAHLNTPSVTAASASLQGFIKFDASNADLLETLNKNAQQVPLIKKLFTQLDQYLNSLVLSNKAQIKQVAPYQALVDLISEYDKTSQDSTFDANDFASRLYEAISSGVNTIQTYLQEYLDHFDSIDGQDSKQPSHNDINNIINLFRPVIERLNSYKDYSNSWTRLMNKDTH